MQLQNDLDHRFRWSTKNQMRSNASKSNIITFTSKRNTLTFNYHLNGEKLAESHCIKYLGIHIQHNLKWDTHIAFIINKASRMLGLLKHTLYNAPVKIKKQAYYALCKPILRPKQTIAELGRNCLWANFRKRQLAHT